MLGTRLHRLYKNRFDKMSAQNIVDESNNDRFILSLPSEYPSGEGDSAAPTAPGLSGPNMKIEGIHDPTSAMIAIMLDPDTKSQVAEAFNLTNDEADKLHVTLMCVNDLSSDAERDRVMSVLDAVCAGYSRLHCAITGVGIFDTNDDLDNVLYASITAPHLTELRTDILRCLDRTNVSIDKKFDFVPHMTLSYLPNDNIDTVQLSSLLDHPEITWTASCISLVSGDNIIGTADFDGSHIKDAGGFGLSFEDILSPGIGDGFLDNHGDNHQTENLSEDVDLKLGQIDSSVEEPYSDSQGPLSFRFDDDKKYDITKGAIGIPDTVVDENKYTDTNIRPDNAIPRDPATEDMR